MSRNTRDLLDGSNDGFVDDSLPTTATTADTDSTVDPQDVPNATFARWARSLPCLNHIPIFSEAASAYGPSLVLSLALVYMFSSGASDNIVSASLQPMFMLWFGVDGIRYQRLSSLYRLGVTLKPLVAVLSDTFALFGYTKRWYLFFFCLEGGALLLGYGLLPRLPSSANIAAAFIFLATFGRASTEILSQGFYSRQMRKNPKHGAAIVSWVWGMVYLGSAIGSCVIGPMSDAGLTHRALLIAMAMRFLLVPIFVFNFYGEPKNREERLTDVKMQYLDDQLARQALEASAHDDENGPHANDPSPAEGEPIEVASATTRATTRAAVPVSSSQKPFAAPKRATLGFEAVQEEEGENPNFTVRADDGDLVDLPPPRILSAPCNIVEMNVDMAKRNWRVLAYSLVMCAGVLALSIVTILGDKWDLLYACIVIAVVLITLIFFAMPLVVAKACTFIFLFFALYPSIPGALNSFYLADHDCVPNGPHFSYTFFNTVAAIITNVAGMAGAMMFSYFFSRQKYWVSFLCTTSLQIISSLFDLILTERWNIYIGIPDHAMYICGDAIIFEVVSTMAWMPAQMLMSRFCPRGSEAIVFSLVAGFGNTGISFANSIGSLFLELAWPVDTTSRPCDFHNVRYLIIVCHLCMPLAIIPLAYFLLPNARVCDDLDENGRVKPPTKSASGDGEDEAMHGSATTPHNEAKKLDGANPATAMAYDGDAHPQPDLGAVSSSEEELEEAGEEAARTNTTTSANREGECAYSI